MRALKYEDVILLCIQYIENNITEKLTVECISKKMGYSIYHFSRIFKEQMGVSLMEYVKERRLLRATEDTLLGKRILDVAVEYGYQTHSGFTKAFRKKYGFSPAFIHAIYIQRLFEGGNCYMNEDKVYENANMFLKGTENYKEPKELYRCLIESIQDNKIFDDFKVLEKAYNLACLAHKGQKRKSGEDYVTHSINVAIILAEMEADKETIEIFSPIAAKFNNSKLKAELDNLALKYV
ncbi:helix-turn-helix domain-containing protein [Clostridium acidisoli]|uniref:helix-turn-helix domain-containing protein n=1 Tax=Clostridium acidisoli TaxID=91624 RepID=UPI001FA83BDD|nr:AraC family transcriptional regulator [Clostridium acidisoli]